MVYVQVLLRDQTARGLPRQSSDSSSDSDSSLSFNFCYAKRQVTAKLCSATPHDESESCLPTSQSSQSPSMLEYHDYVSMCLFLCTGFYRTFASPSSCIPHNGRSYSAARALWHCSLTKHTFPWQQNLLPRPQFTNYMSALSNDEGCALGARGRPVWRLIYETSNWDLRKIIKVLKLGRNANDNCNYMRNVIDQQDDNP